MPQTIVIVGAGFCGSVLASNLLHRPPPGEVEIVLLERGTAMSRGVAYAAHEVPYILNVPTGRLSVNPQDAFEFLRFVRQSQPDADAEDFVPRALYGEYLQDSLDRAERAAPPNARLTRLFGEATRISRSSGSRPLVVHLEGRDAIAADRVVLALGNPPPTVHAWARGLLHHPGYFQDPWRVGRTFRPDQSVLIVGTGLTMVDVALSLSLEGGQMPLVRSISRHGLLPLGQTIFRPKAIDAESEAFMAQAVSIRKILTRSRELAQSVERLGGDWREVVTCIRHIAPSLWQSLPEAERLRFLRHVQAYWDVHRHRVPPRMAARIDHMRQSGRLIMYAGRIRELVPEGEELRVIWRRRASRENESFAVDAVINATGPDYALKRSPDPLFRALRAEGLIMEDPLNLGIKTARFGACLSADGALSPNLFYLGPMLRADHWEATAAPELRGHAERLSRHLADGAI